MAENLGLKVVGSLLMGWKERHTQKKKLTTLLACLLRKKAQRSTNQ